MTPSICRAAGAAIAIAAGALASIASAARGQITAPQTAASASDCPVVGGVHVSATARDTGLRASPRELLRIDRRTAVDTTFTFNVVERRWSLAELAASVAAGVADTTRSRWYLCAGVGVGLQRPTLVVRGARGQIRLRASLRGLTPVPGAPLPDRNRTRTPPRSS